MRIPAGWSRVLVDIADRAVRVAIGGAEADTHILARFKSEAIPVAVGLYITAAYWFTASTSFANPAVTIARALTNSFSGIAPVDVPMFIVAQLAGALAGLGVMRWFFIASPALAPGAAAR